MSIGVRRPTQPARSNLDHKNCFHLLETLNPGIPLATDRTPLVEQLGILGRGAQSLLLGLASELNQRSLSWPLIQGLRGIVGHHEKPKVQNIVYHSGACPARIHALANQRWFQNQCFCFPQGLFPTESTPCAKPRDHWQPQSSRRQRRSQQYRHRNSWSNGNSNRK